MKTSTQTHPAPCPISFTQRWPIFFVALLACLLPLSAAVVAPVYSSADQVPLTAAGYTASGNTLDVTLNFAPTPGTTLTVVNNTALGFISGAFDNLPNGTALDLTFGGQTYSFVAWYYGGTGNDLVLLWANTGLAAWGNNANGQLGDNSATSSLVPVDAVLSGVLQGKTIVQVARGSNHSVALCTDGTVAAWGRDLNGKIGINVDADTDYLVPQAVNHASGVSALFGKTVIAVAAGQHHSLALCSDGTVAAWGNSSSGQLGNNSTFPDRLVPVAVNTTSGTSALFGKTVVAIAAGRSHNLALCTDGTVAAWGHNTSGSGGGALGNDSSSLSSVPVAVSTTGASVLNGRSVSAISAGFAFSLALCTDGTVAAWGENSNGQLGNNSTNDAPVPVAVNLSGVLSGKTVTKLVAGGFHSLALCSDGTLAAWGRDTNGQLGRNSFGSDSSLPVLVNRDSGTSALFGKTVIALDAGDQDSAALASDGTAFAWGFNSNGQLGDNSTTRALVPVAVNTASGVSVLSGRRAVSLSSSGQSSSYGVAIYGQATAPDIVVEQPATVGLSSGATSEFGAVTVGTTLDREYGIKNSGNAPLTDLDVTITGPDAALFTVVEQPLFPVAPVGGLSNFTVRFSPQTIGTKTATLHIASNDPDESPFSLVLTGGGLPGNLTPRDSTRNWRGVAISDNGLKMAAVVSNGYLYTSANGGGTWTEATTLGQKSWYGVAGSSDGTKLVAVADGYRIFTSIDSGATWTQQTSTSASKWRSVASSADGTKLVAGDYQSRLATSTDSGVTWIGRGNNANWTSVASSSDGTKLVAAAQAGFLYTSIDSGVTWTARMTDVNRAWSAVASSADGTKLVAAGYPSTNIYTSTDSGVTWTSRASARSWQGLASSADGTLLYASEDNGNLHVSTNSGVTWDSFESTRRWYGVATTPTGSKLLASDFGGFLYISGSEPEIVIEQPADTDLTSGASSDFGVVLAGEGTASLTYTIKNLGFGSLTGLGITFTGANAADFSVTLAPTAPVAANGSTTFTLRFAPLAGGSKSATLQIASNDGDESPFTLLLSGTALGNTTDTDSDGLNDAAEYRLSSLGFNWQVAQVTLVDDFLAKNALFTQSEYDAGRQAGRDDVTLAPNSYDLYNLAQVQSLNVGTPLLQRTGLGQFKLTIGVEKTTSLSNAFQPLPLTAPATIINGQGELEFLFTVPENTAFFRLQAK
jgi:alpha-tubulin suppressor-like RCC1 family protein